MVRTARDAAVLVYAQNVLTVARETVVSWNEAVDTLAQPVADSLMRVARRDAVVPVDALHRGALAAHSVFRRSESVYAGTLAVLSGLVCGALPDAAPTIDAQDITAVACEAIASCPKTICA